MSTDPQFRQVPQRYVEAVPVDQLAPHPKNVNEGDVGAIVALIDETGFYGAVVVQESTGLIIAGKHRWLSATQRGAATLPVLFVDVDDDTALRMMLGDNRANRLGRDDPQNLATLLIDLEASNRGLAGTGFDGDDLSALVADLEAAGAVVPVREHLRGLTDVDEVSPVPRDPVTRTGDVWILGPHRLVCGDATSDEAWAALLPNGERAACVWTDPPYGIDYVGGTPEALVIQNDDLSAADLSSLLSASLSRTLSASAPGAAWFVAGPDMHGVFQAFVDVLHDLGVYRMTIVWVKDRFVLGRADYHHRHEFLFYGWAPGAAHRGPPDRSQDTVWSYPRPVRSEEHPTMKPVALIERALVNHTDHGDLVLDPFGGSGSTLIAAHTSGRVAALIELAPAYCDVICHRYQKHTGRVPILERSGDAVDFIARYGEATGAEVEKEIPPAL